MRKKEAAEIVKRRNEAKKLLSEACKSIIEIAEEDFKYGIEELFMYDDEGEFEGDLNGLQEELDLARQFYSEYWALQNIVNDFDITEDGE